MIVWRTRRKIIGTVLCCTVPPASVLSRKHTHVSSSYRWTRARFLLFFSCTLTELRPLCLYWGWLFLAFLCVFSLRCCWLWVTNTGDYQNDLLCVKWDVIPFSLIRLSLCGCCRPESAFLETISYFPMVYWMIGSIEKYLLHPRCVTLSTLKTSCSSRNTSYSSSSGLSSLQPFRPGAFHV